MLQLDCCTLQSERLHNSRRVVHYSQNIVRSNWSVVSYSRSVYTTVPVLCAEVSALCVTVKKPCTTAELLYATSGSVVRYSATEAQRCAGERGEGSRTGADQSLSSVHLKIRFSGFEAKLFIFPG